jgi:hypothetical protein
LNASLKANQKKSINKVKVNDDIVTENDSPLVTLKSSPSATSISATNNSNKNTNTNSSSKEKIKFHSFQQIKLTEDEILEANKLDHEILNKTIFLKFARHNPKVYLQIIGHIIVFSELIALLTPTVAMGIQWITAFCDGPPVLVMLELLSDMLTCFPYGKCEFDVKHCILKH